MAEEVTSTVIGKVVDLLFNTVKREINYVRNCSENVKDLRDKVQDLTDMRDGIQPRIDEARTGKGERPVPGVEDWVKKANTLISDAEEFLEKEAKAKKTCFNLRICVNFCTLHHHGKVASSTSNDLLKHKSKGQTYETRVSIPTSTPSFVQLYPKNILDGIDSQKLVLGKIVTALSDESKQIVAIYGSGGVGKSTLACEAAAKVNNLFADIVHITVTETVDVKDIRKSVEVASKRIMNGDKVLIILDDIWEKLLLPDLGIPCGNNHMNCKILLTSRRKTVCEAMTDNVICVNPLTEEESWTLFRHVVGERLVADLTLEDVAKKITQECGGLPLIIQAVGTALKKKPIDIWVASLDQLQNHAPLDIDQEIRRAFSHLKLSYDLLESEEAQSCFLLCSMFKEDQIIELKVLAEYGVGLGIFKNLDSIDDARNRVQIAVETLKSCFLLLPAKEQIEVRMHDVVRDVALLIGKDKYLVKAGKGLTEWKPRKNTSGNYSRISLMENKIRKLPDHQLHFPLLDTFFIQHSELSVVPDEFFGGMREVKVLDMSRNNISSLPQSLKLLTKLITLDLSFNQSLQEISILGELIDLEILNLRGTGIERIPEEIGQLINLRLLDVDDCNHLYHTPGIISKLTSLEELYIDVRGFHVRSEFDLEELHNLKSLKTLHLYVPKAHPFPKSNHLKEFFIHIGGKLLDRRHPQTSHIKRRLQILACDIPYMKQCKELIQVSGVLILQWIKDLDNILPEVYQDSFGELKCITLENCHNVTCLVKTFVTSNDIGDQRTTKEKFFSQVEQIKLEALSRLELLWNCPHEYVSFRNLQRIKIERCYSLSILFPVSVAQGLVNLRDIWIWKCDSLVAVISAGDEQTLTGSEIEQTDADIVFPCLTNIWFHSLAKLSSFYSGHSTINYPSLEFIEVKQCPSMERWGYGVHDMPQINFHHQGTPCSINDIITVHHETKERITFGTSSWQTI